MYGLYGTCVDHEEAADEAVVNVQLSTSCRALHAGLSAAEHLEYRAKRCVHLQARAHVGTGSLCKFSFIFRLWQPESQLWLFSSIKKQF